MQYRMNIVAKLSSRQEVHANQLHSDYIEDMMPTVTNCHCFPSKCCLPGQHTQSAKRKHRMLTFSRHGVSDLGPQQRQNDLCRGQLLLCLSSIYALLLSAGFTRGSHCFLCPPDSKLFLSPQQQSLLCSIQDTNAGTDSAGKQAGPECGPQQVQQEQQDDGQGCVCYPHSRLAHNVCQDLWLLCS